MWAKLIRIYLMSLKPAWIVISWRRSMQPGITVHIAGIPIATTAMYHTTMFSTSTFLKPRTECVMLRCLLYDSNLRLFKFTRRGEKWFIKTASVVIPHYCSIRSWFHQLKIRQFMLPTGYAGNVTVKCHMDGSTVWAVRQMPGFHCPKVRFRFGWKKQWQNN